MAEPFGFQVSHRTEADSDEWTKPGWFIELPHQCDSWDIAGEHSHPVSQQEAITELSRFIAEAQAALEALMAGREFGDPA